MPEFLNEAFLTVTDGELIFPNVQTCCAVILSGVSKTQRRQLGGYHLTATEFAEQYITALNHLRQGFAQVEKIYLVGNLFASSRKDTAGACVPPSRHRSILQKALGCNDIRFYNKDPAIDDWAVRAWIDVHDHTVRVSYASAKVNGWEAIPNCPVTSEMMVVKQDNQYHFRK